MDRLTIIVLLSSTLSACISVDPKNFKQTEALPTVLEASANAARPAAYANEPPLTPEQWGLALSGGGIRSAGFAIGALSGLNESGLLKQVGAISSVSGGGYAAYWYYMRVLHAKQLNPDIFFDCLPAWWMDKLEYKALGRDAVGFAKVCGSLGGGRRNDTPEVASAFHWLGSGDPARWQHYLSQRMDIFLQHPQMLDGTPGVDAKGAIKGTILSILSDPTRSRRFYQYGIERAFGLEPNPRALRDLISRKPCNTSKWSYANSIGGLPKQEECAPNVLAAAGDTTVSPLADGGPGMAALVPLTNAKTVPLWIVNMAADSNPRKTSAEHIFEVTPFGYGSRAHGYVKGILPELNLSDLVATSGAVLDRQAPLDAVSELEHAGLAAATRLGFGWGRDIGGYSPHHQARVHLSDGGHVENLGVYSLLRRGYKKIIAIDGSFDRPGQLSDLCKLRGYLNDEGMALTFPTLKDLDEVCSGSKVFDLYAWHSPVHVGTVRRHGSTSDEGDATIYYAKLAWNQGKVRSIFNAYKHYTDHVSQTGAAVSSTIPVAETCDAKRGHGHGYCMLAIYYGHNSEMCEAANGRLVFPQYNTYRSTADASGYMFWGLRELGKNAALAASSLMNGASRESPITPQMALPRNHQFGNYGGPGHANCLCWETYGNLKPDRIRDHKCG